jgi:hypothetical protein
MAVFNTRLNNQYIGVLETVSTQVQSMLSGYGILQTVRHTKILGGKFRGKMFTHILSSNSHTHTYSTKWQFFLWNSNNQRKIIHAANLTSLNI